MSFVPVTDDFSPPTVGEAVGAWAAAWLAGSVLSSIVASVSGAPSIREAGAGWLALAMLATWIPMLIGVWWFQRPQHPQRLGLRSLAERFGLGFRRIDLLGIPLGIATQLLLVRAVYLPLKAIWPNTFSLDRIEESARTLYDSVSGSTAGIVALVLLVTVGAPVVEELMYRGLLQPTMVRRFGPRVGISLVALWFALIHFQPVGIPGLFAVGLVLGLCQWRTRSLGLAILTHLAFNATGLWLVSR